jgi:hypothetical protein
MPKKIVVKVNWDVEKPTEMAAFTHTVATNLTANAVTFPTPPYTPTLLNTAATLVENTFTNRNNGDVARLAFENAVKDLDTKLHAVADYVSNVANGDTTKIDITGFSATSNTRTPAVRITTIAPPTLTPIMGGMVKSVIPAIKNADNYTHIACTDPSTIITVMDNQIKFENQPNQPVYIIANGNANETFTNLATQSRLFVWVVAHNTAGNSPLSPMVSTAVI